MLKEESAKQQKAIQTFETQVNILNSKITKLRNRKNIDLNKKTCQSCNKEYAEGDNYNWSCCIHRSEWGGTMWWCCGKTKINAPGCLFRKHISKEEENENDSDKDQSRAKRQKCYACKELGHLIQDCPRDPNIRTTKSLEKEMLRINSKINRTSNHTDLLAITDQMLQ